MQFKTARFAAYRRRRCRRHSQHQQSEQKRAKTNIRSLDCRQRRRSGVRDSKRFTKGATSIAIRGAPPRSSKFAAHRRRRRTSKNRRTAARTRAACGQRAETRAAGGRSDKPSGRKRAFKFCSAIDATKQSARPFIAIAARFERSTNKRSSKTSARVVSIDKRRALLRQRSPSSKQQANERRASAKANAMRNERRLAAVAAMATATTSPASERQREHAHPIYS